MKTYQKILGIILVCIVIIISIGALMHHFEFTFQAVDQIYCRGYLPWAAEMPKSLDCSQYRSGDDIFENDFIVGEMRRLASNPYQQVYSERIMNGYPIAYAYSASKISLFYWLTAWLPSWSAINVSALVTLVAGFFLGYGIARTLNFSNSRALIAGVLAIPLPLVALFESWNWSLLGYELAVFGILQMYCRNRPWIFASSVILGAWLIFSTSIYQLIMYAGMCLGIMGLFYFDVKDRRQFLKTWLWSGVIFVLVALALHESLLGHYQFLQESNKVGNDIPLVDLISSKNLGADPLGWIGDEPVKAHRKLVSWIFGENIGYGWYAGFANGSYSPGPAAVLLAILGFWKMRKKWRALVFLVLFWVLYRAGAIQLLLSIVIGDPFKSETSIRAPLLVFLFMVPAVLVALDYVQDSVRRAGKFARILVPALLSYLIVLPVTLYLYRRLTYGHVFLESLFIAVTALTLLVAWYCLRGSGEQRKKVGMAFIVCALLLPTVTRLFLGIPPRTLSLQSSVYYFPETAFIREIKQHPEIQRVALVQTPGNLRIHPNTPVWMGLSTIHGYRNPMYRHYNEVFTFYRFIFEEVPNPEAALESYRISLAFTTNDLPVWQAPRPTMSLPTRVKEFFAMAQVNTIIGSHDLVVDDAEWRNVASGDGLSLWIRNYPQPEWRFADANANMTMIEKHDGYRKIKIVATSGGILTLPVTYDKHWVATLNGEPLTTFVSEGAFLGIAIPEVPRISQNSNTLEVCFACGD